MSKKVDGPVSILGGLALGPGIAKATTGIRGLDTITDGGLPQGRTTLVVGGTGAGKTLLGLQFLVAGARRGEPGVFVTFEESPAKIASNVSSLGFDLNALQKGGMLTIHSFQVDPTEVIEVGAFDFEPLFLLLGDTIGRLGVKRIVLDTLEMLFGTFRDAAMVRGELGRLFRWLEERGVTAIVTGERSSVGLTRYGIEEYVSDCVIVLDHRVSDEVSTRRLRVVKYRGSAHGTNEYPFFISPRGFVMLPITSVALDYPASVERIPTGIDRLDHMLSGGYYRGTTVLVSGMAGTGKTTMGAALLNAACARGERALMVSFEESPDQVIRNMDSVGLQLRRWVDAGLLRLWSARPTAFGLEAHLGVLTELLDEVAPTVAVLDGLSSLNHGPNSNAVAWTVARQLDLLKGRGVTALATTLGHGDEGSQVGVSSLVDTWLLLRNLESNGERNRVLFVIKSRGTAHSNQVREFSMSERGVELLDVNVGAAGLVVGSARLTHEIALRDAETQRGEELAKRLRDLQQTVTVGEFRLDDMVREIEAAKIEIERITSVNDSHNVRGVADRAAMARQRWADPTVDEGVEP